jgi:L-ascorbate metabolism protein UlaG (beta-lactamase superfamily)
MPVDVRWLGHAALEIHAGPHTLIIDPFITGNPAATAKVADLEPDFILISHGHEDHVGDAVELAKRTGATVVSNFEIVNWIQRQGVEKVHAMHIGGGHTFPFGRLKLTLAFHGSGLPDGSYGGNPAGFHLFLNDGPRIYAACDTALFGDMALIGDEGVDLAILPIGDNYTMGPDDALRAVKLLRPAKVLPVHYNTWDLIGQDPEAWARRVRAETKAEPVVLRPGETLTLD